MLGQLSALSGHSGCGHILRPSFAHGPEGCAPMGILDVRMEYSWTGEVLELKAAGLTQPGARGAFCAKSRMDWPWGRALSEGSYPG